MDMGSGSRWLSWPPDLTVAPGSHPLRTGRVPRSTLWPDLPIDSRAAGRDRRRIQFHPNEKESGNDFIGRE